MAKDKPAGKDKQAKGKGKKGKGDAEAAVKEPKAGALSFSLAEHPRAVYRIKQAKEAGGLVGFLLGGYLALPTHTLAATGVTALVAGVACYVFMWGISVFLWRHLVVAELRSREHEMLASELAKLEGSGLAEATGAGRANARVAS